MNTDDISAARLKTHTILRSQKAFIKRGKLISTLFVFPMSAPHHMNYIDMTPYRTSYSLSLAWHGCVLARTHFEMLPVLGVTWVALWRLGVPPVTLPATDAVSAEDI